SGAAVAVSFAGRRCGATRRPGRAGFTGLLGLGLGGLRPPDLTGLRVDLATVTHYYPWLLTVAVVAQFSHFFSSSSTISASTTLSSPEAPAPAEAVAPPAFVPEAGPSLPAAACCAACVLAYSAVPM